MTSPAAAARSAAWLRDVLPALPFLPLEVVLELDVVLRYVEGQTMVCGVCNGLGVYVLPFVPCLACGGSGSWADPAPVPPPPPDDDDTDTDLWVDEGGES